MLAGVHSCTLMLQTDSAHGRQILLKRAEHKARRPHLALLVQQQHCKQTSQMHGRDSQLSLLCVSVRKDRERLHTMQVVVVCLKQWYQW